MEELFCEENRRNSVEWENIHEERKNDSQLSEETWEDRQHMKEQKEGQCSLVTLKAPHEQAEHGMKKRRRLPREATLRIRIQLEDERYDVEVERGNQSVEEDGTGRRDDSQHDEGRKSEERANQNTRKYLAKTSI